MGFVKTRSIEIFIGGSRGLSELDSIANFVTDANIGREISYILNCFLRAVISDKFPTLAESHESVELTQSKDRKSDFVLVMRRSQTNDIFDDLLSFGLLDLDNGRISFVRGIKQPNVKLVVSYLKKIFQSMQWKFGTIPPGRLPQWV